MKFYIYSVLFVLSLVSCTQKMPNEKVAEAHIWGNCDMCKKTIEESGNIKNEVAIDWNPKSKMAKIKFDSTKTNLNEILRKISVAGYDNELFVGDSTAYSNLHSCCQYDRK